MHHLLESSIWSASSACLKLIILCTRNSLRSEVFWVWDSNYPGFCGYLKRHKVEFMSIRINMKEALLDGEWVFGLIASGNERSERSL